MFSRRIPTELTRLSKRSHNSSLPAYRQRPKRRHHSPFPPPQRANLGAFSPAYLSTTDYTCSASSSSTLGVLHPNLLQHQEQPGSTFALCSDIYTSKCKIITSYAIHIISLTLIELPHHVRHLHNPNSVKIN